MVLVMLLILKGWHKSSSPNQPFFGTKYHVIKLRVGDDLPGGFPRLICFLPKLVTKPFCHIFSSKFNQLHPQTSNSLNPPSLLVLVYLGPLSLCLNSWHLLSLSLYSLSPHTHTHSLSLSRCTHTQPLFLLSLSHCKHTHTHSLSHIVHTHTHSLSRCTHTHTISLSCCTHTHTLSLTCSRTQLFFTL